MDLTQQEELFIVAGVVYAVLVKGARDNAYASPDLYGATLASDAFAWAQCFMDEAAKRMAKP